MVNQIASKGRKMKKLILILMVGSLFAQNTISLVDSNKYRISASTTLESLAEDRESERKIGGGILAGLGLLFFINTGDEELNTGLRISGTIISGIGIAVLAIKSKAEKKYNKIKDIDDKEEREALSYNHLVYLSDEAKRMRKYGIAINSALSAYYIFGQPNWGYPDNREYSYNKDMNLLYGLIYGVSAFNGYTQLSKEEKALDNYLNQ